LAGNLSDRLKRIQLVKQNEQKSVTQNHENIVLQGWSSAGYMTLKREITDSKSIVFPKNMPDAAGIVMPGINRTCDYRDLLFFDLETTGLSGGAGTVAFLAAFGRFLPVQNQCNNTEYNLHITQYLLLDYPGENDFIEAVLGEITPDCTIVSYNGKCFDSQILKNRCLMNGIMPPEYRHADLLYPARRLWKRLLPDCSQATIETGILNIDRTGDIPGAMAPEIWFAFLRDGDTGPRLGICEHNRKDIAGLASIFCAMVTIADEPIVAAEKIYFDIETLSLRWNEVTQRSKRDSEQDLHLAETGIKLMRFAAEKKCPCAQLQYARFLFRSGNYGEGRTWLQKAADAEAQPLIQATALRSLAIDSERRLKNVTEAIGFAERGLELLPQDSPRRNEFERRLERLRKKLET
jgi:uncharacterized protein YprB with RNaseH-like and TPR domain